MVWVVGVTRDFWALGIARRSPSRRAARLESRPRPPRRPWLYMYVYNI